MLKKSSGTARVWPSRYLYAHPCPAHQIFDLPTLAGSHFPRSHRCLCLADTALMAHELLIPWPQELCLLKSYLSWSFSSSWDSGTS